jgi:2-keto-4-pentenoate hydratase/2-oxohepta-3-ene-1,7-dioic acid hydratase in catechol pathway
MTWSLVTYQSGDSIELGILLEDGSVVAPPELKQWDSMLDLLDDWKVAEQELKELAITDAPVVEFDKLLAPVRWPRKVICAGVNYRRHIREMGGEVPGDSWVPFFFLKPPTTTVIGPTDNVVVHSPDSAGYDWEVELAVVIGIGGRDISRDNALDHVAGYCVANDITARKRHKRETVPAAAFTYDWVASKAIDTSFPMGPGITPAFLVPNAQDLRMRLWVNGELHQDESTSDMICTIAELISAASRIITLEAGDVIATGTPSGVGSSRGLSLGHRDIVRTSIDGLGTLENHVVNPKEARA